MAIPREHRRDSPPRAFLSSNDFLALASTNLMISRSRARESASSYIAGVVHGQEYVQPKKTVDYYGLTAMAALHQRRIPAEKLQALVGNYRYEGTPRIGSFETGGAVAAITESAASSESSTSAAGATKLSNYLVFDRDELRKQILNDDASEIWVTDVMNKRSYRVRKRI